MPCIITTQLGDTLTSLVDQYYRLNTELDPASLDEIARLNNISPTSFLPASKLIVLPDSASAGMCRALDYETANLAMELNAKGRDPLTQFLDSGAGEELLAALEFTEALDAHTATKAFFGGSLGASAGLYNEFIKAHDDYKNKLSQYANGPTRERRLLKREIAAAAKNVQALFAKIVAQMVHYRRNTRPKKLKMLPHSAMGSVKTRGDKSVYLRDSADIRRVRWVARGAKVLGAGALLLDVGIAARNIKRAHEIGNNSTRVAFEEIGAITAEIALGLFATYSTSMAVAGIAPFLPFAIIPGVGLIIVIAAGAIGALAGNIYGKKLGAKLYKYTINNTDSVLNPITANRLKAL